MFHRIVARMTQALSERGRGTGGRAPALFVALVAIPLILACGVGLLSVAQAPARDLTLNIRISDQGAASGKVWVMVAYTVMGYSGRVQLSSAHTLTCNGVPIGLNAFSSNAQVPRQPAGGAYVFVYTDEQGRRTGLTVPVAPGQFAITTPAEGAHVTLPRQPSLEPSPTVTGSGITTGGSGAASLVTIDATPAPPTTPTAPPAPTPPPTPIPSSSATPAGQIRSPQMVSQPPVVIRYTTPDIPASAQARFSATAYCGPANAPTCGAIYGPSLEPTGTYTLTDSGLAPGYGFEAFKPGAGAISAQFEANWELPPSGFNAVTVIFIEDTTVHIVWT